MSTTRTRGHSSANELSRVAWHISSRSPSSGGNCVEAGPVRDGSGRVALRHSHRPDGPAHLYTGDEWSVFLAGAKHGHFDFTA